MGQTLCSKRKLEGRPQLNPIRIRAGAIGSGQPTQDLLVSPQHRVLVRSRIAERMFGQYEILVAAKHLLALDGIEIADDLHEVIYVHLLCDQHEIIYSNGAPTETLYLGSEATRILDTEDLQEIKSLFPDLIDEFDMKPSRYLASGRRSRSLAERHKKNGRALLEDFPLTEAQMCWTSFHETQQSRVNLSHHWNTRLVAVANCGEGPRYRVSVLPTSCGRWLACRPVSHFRSRGT